MGRFWEGNGGLGQMGILWSNDMMSALSSLSLSKLADRRELHPEVPRPVMAGINLGDWSESVR
jgi:hypothetical protein